MWNICRAGLCSWCSDGTTGVLDLTLARPAAVCGHGDRRRFARVFIDHRHQLAWPRASPWRPNEVYHLILPIDERAAFPDRNMHRF